MINENIDEGVRTPTIALALVAGSATRTLRMVGSELQRRSPATRIVEIDMEALVLDRSRMDAVSYDDAAHTVTPQSANRLLGIVSSLVTRLRNGSPLARKTAAAAFPVLRAIQPVSRTYVRSMRALFRRESVTVLLTCNDLNLASRSVIHAAHCEGIPTILLQEGPFTIVRYRGRFLARAAAKIRRGLGRYRSLDSGVDYGTAGHDRVLAVSDEYVRRFAGIGIAPERLAAIGTVRFDMLADIRARSAARPTVTYIFQPFIAQRRVNSAVLPLLIAAMEGLNRAYGVQPFDLVFKTHPRADPATVERMTGQLRIPYRLSGPEDEFGLVMAGSRCAVGHYSTGLVEAILVDVPAVCIPVPPDHFAMAEEGAKQVWFANAGFPMASDAKAVECAVLSALAAGGRNVPLSALADEIGPTDGRATIRAADHVEQVMSVRP